MNENFEYELTPIDYKGVIKDIVSVLGGCVSAYMVYKIIKSMTVATSIPGKILVVVGTIGLMNLTEYEVAERLVKTFDEFEEIIVIWKESHTKSK